MRTLKPHLGRSPIGTKTGEEGEPPDAPMRFPRSLEDTGFGLTAATAFQNLYGSGINNVIPAASIDGVFAHVSLPGSSRAINARGLESFEHADPHYRCNAHRRISILSKKQTA